MSDYTSQGTVRVEFPAKKGARITLHFVPVDNFSVKHRGKTYAIFMGKNCTDAITKKYRERGIPIMVRRRVGLVLHNAGQVEVEVKVKKAGKKFELVSVEIPAR